MHLGQIRHLYNNWWRAIFATIISAIFFGWLYIWKLASLTPGFSFDEIDARTQSSNIQAIVNNPINLPHKLIQYLLQATGHHGPLAMRSVSVFFGLVGLWCFFIICKWWFNTRIALLASLSLAVSPFYIINSRNSTSNIMLASIMAMLIAAYLWVAVAERTKLAALLMFILIVAMSLYTPGVIWAALPAAIFFSSFIWAEAKKLNKYLPFILIAVVLIILSPMIWAVSKNHQIGSQLLLIPQHLNSVVESIKSIAWAGLGIVWRTRDNYPITIGYLPIMDVFGIVTGFFGCFYIARQYNRRRSYVLFISLAFIIIASGLLANFYVMLLALPILYLLVAAGLSYLFDEWFSVFPRNPFARYLAVSVVALCIGIHTLYGIRYSLIAWPRAPETKQVYMIQ